MRRVQEQRKKAGLQKTDLVNLYLQVEEESDEKSIGKFIDTIIQKCGADVCVITTRTPTVKYKNSSEEKIKDKMIKVFFNKV